MISEYRLSRERNFSERIRRIDKPRSHTVRGLSVGGA